MSLSWFWSTIRELGIPFPCTDQKEVFCIRFLYCLCLSWPIHFITDLMNNLRNLSLSWCVHGSIRNVGRNEMCWLSVSKEEILGKSVRVERKGLWLQAWGKQRTWLEFLWEEKVAKTKLHRTILGTLNKGLPAHINDIFESDIQSM